MSWQSSIIDLTNENSCEAAAPSAIPSTISHMRANNYSNTDAFDRNVGLRAQPQAFIRPPGATFHSIISNINANMRATNSNVRALPTSIIGGPNYNNQLVGVPRINTNITRYPAPMSSYFGRAIPSVAVSNASAAISKFRVTAMNVPANSSSRANMSHMASAMSECFVASI